MLEAIRNFVVGCGIGGLLLLVGSVLLFSAALPRSWEDTKTWVQRPRPLVGVTCLAASLVFILFGSLSLLI